MEQLSSIDASFIHAEHPGLPMHISALSIYDPSTAPGGKVRFKDILRLYEEAMYEVPLLRRRLVTVPGNMDFPFWREEPSLDVEFHVRHIALPKPGDWRQFYIQLARLHSRQLDVQRPLWEVYVIEGLNDLDGIPSGCFAILQKLHHAAMDGAASQRMFEILNKPHPDDPWGLDAMGKTLIREPQPQNLPLLWDAGRRYLKRPAQLAKLAGTVVGALRRVQAGENSGELEKPPEAPKSRFNQAASPHRVITTATFDLADILHLRHAVEGATVNDIALTICGGALRSYLRGKGDIPDSSLVAQVPVNIRRPGDSDVSGNQIETIACACGTDIEDPLERLHAVMRSTSVGKKRLMAMGDNMTADMSEAMGPHLTKLLYDLIFDSSSLGPLAGLLPTPPNFVFSNTIGPRAPVYMCGAEFVWGTGFGPVMPTSGLFVTANSLLGRFIFGITACREMMPDPEVFNDCLHQSFDEVRTSLRNLADESAPLKKAASSKQDGPAPKKKSTRRKPVGKDVATLKKKA